MPPWFARQSCRIVNDRVFGHVCGGDRGRAGERKWPGRRGADPRVRRRGRKGTASRDGPYGPTARRCLCRGPLRVACARPAGGRPPDPPGGARARHAREATGKYLVGAVDPGADGSGRAGSPGTDRFRTHPGPPCAPGRAPAVRRLTRPLNGVRPRRTGPVNGARRAGGEPVRVSPRAASGPTVPWGPVTHPAPGHRDRPAWADLPTAPCRPRRIRRSAGAAGKLA